MNFTKSVVFASLLLGSMTALPTLEATAQDAYENGQYDVFIDDRGRRIYVDPYTGEIVRVVTNDRRARRFERRNRRLSERPSIFEERRLRRLERRARLEEELEDIFSDREQPRDDRYFDQPEIEQDRRIERRQLEPTVDDETRIARLPKADDPDRMTDVEPRPSWLKAKPKMSRDTITKLQVFLDREGFSPGVIDGAWGANVSKAIAAWQEVKGEDADLTNPLILDKYINKPDFKAFTRYTITSADVNQDFAAAIPSDYAQKAKMKSMAYTSSAERLAERFHMSEAYLRRLNPGATFDTVGETIRVVSPGNNARRKVHYVVADKSRKQVRAYDRNGALVAAYPATIGSTATPSPSGKVEVTRIALDPNYTYNPKINFRQGDNNKVLTIPPGPNGPVGSVWIALSKPTYGIHGTPNPDKIGKTNSHGCIRLTNWDAKELAGLISKGVVVEFQG